MTTISPANLPTFNAKTQEAPRLVHASLRVTLTPEQRQQLKDKINELVVTSTPRGAISVETTTQAACLQAYGFNRTLLIDLITSRESISLTTIYQLEEITGIKLVTDKQLLDSAKSYIEFAKASVARS